MNGYWSTRVDVSALRPGMTVVVTSADPTVRHQVYPVVEVREIHEIDFVDKDIEWFDEHPLAARTVHAVTFAGLGARAIRGRRYFDVVDAEHHPVCVSCGEYWPCRHQRGEQAVAAYQRRLSRMCAHCHQEVEHGQFAVSFSDPDNPGERVMFHGRKRNGCGPAAEAWAKAHGRPYEVKA